MALSLSDALVHYRSVSDTTHKFWGYFQATAAGTAAFAWSRDVAQDAVVLIALGLAFAIFAVLNGRLVVASQKDAMTVAKCIKAYARDPEIAIPIELTPLIQTVQPDSPLVVGVWHAGLSIATLVAIWCQHNSLAQ